MRVGYLTFHVGHLDYVGDNTTKYIIIGVVIGAAVLIVLIAVCVGIVCYRTKKNPVVSSTHPLVNLNKP